MKKTISLILAISLIMSVFVAGSVSTSAAETETLIYSFDEVYNATSPVTTAFNTNVAVESNEKTEGSGSTWMNFTHHTGQTANVGGMFFIDFSVAKDLSSYDKIRFDIYTPVAFDGNGGKLQFNFVTGNTNQDGYNWDADITFANIGWNTITIHKAVIPMAVTADWTSINRIRVTWFNESQIDNVNFFLLDNLRGVNGEPDSTSSTTPSTPSTSEPGLLHAFDSGDGFTPVANGSYAGMNTTDKTQGSAAFQWKFPQPTTGGTLLYYDYSSSQDFSSYDYFQLDVYIPVAISGGMIEFDMCSSNAAQNGFNFEIFTSELKVGWNTVTLEKTTQSGDEGATWSDIRRLRWLWHNENSVSVDYFIFDNLRGFVDTSNIPSNTDPNKGHTPYEVDGDLMINNGDSLAGWIGQFNSNIAFSAQHVEGTKAVAMTASVPVGQSASVGAMAWFDFPTTDLSSYSYISLNLFISDPLPGAHNIQINFTNTDDNANAQDGYNYNWTDAADKEAGWYHVVIPMSAFQHAVSTVSWSAVNRIRVTWFNNPQIATNVSFSFDGIMAHKEAPESSNPIPSEIRIYYAPTPRVMEDGSLMINDCETIEGWTGFIGTQVRKNTTNFKEGTSGVRMINDQVMNNAGNSGSMAIIEYEDIDFSNYEHFSFQVYYGKQLEGRQELQVNFISRSSPTSRDEQDGFNYSVDITDWEEGRWYTVRFDKEDFNPAAYEFTSWDNIGRMRITWFNMEQAETAAVLTFDDFRAYPAGYDFEPLPPDYYEGDVSRDDKVNAADALLALQFSVGRIELTPKQQYIADVISPSGVNSVDALTILQLVVKKIDEFDSTYSKASVVSTYKPYEPDPVSIPDSVVKNNAYGKDGDDGSDKSYKTTTLGIKPKTIYVVSATAVARTVHHQRLMYSLQGLMNRDFGMDEKHSSVMYVNLDSSDGTWLNYFTVESKTSPFYGFDIVKIGSWYTFFKTFKPLIEQSGYILWDPNVPATANVAATICGLDGYLPVMAGSDLETFLKEEGIAQKMSLVGKFNGSTTGSAKNDAYRWALDNYFDRCSYEYIAYTVDGAPVAPGNPVAADGDSYKFCIENHDYLIARRAFFIDLNPYAGDRPEDAPSASKGLDQATLKMVFERRYNRAGGKIGAFMGFVPWWIKYTSDCGNATAGGYTSYQQEWLLSEIIACYNMGKEADAWPTPSMTNGSVSYKYTVTDKFVNNKTAKVTNYNSGIHYFTFYIGDYDSSAWLKEYVTKFWMGEATRGKVDLMWSINPNLANRVPMAFEYMYDHKTDCDYFAAGEGAGYLIPTGLFQNKTPRLFGTRRSTATASQTYADYAKKLYDMCDMDITGFLIMGNNTIDTDIADMYRQFSPAAVFHQSSWLFAKRGDTPFIVCRQEGIDIATASSELYKHSFTAMSGYNFSAFRTIIQSPTQIKQMVDNYTSYCATRGKTVQYVDPYSFISLAKQSGKLVNK